MNKKNARVNYTVDNSGECEPQRYNNKMNTLCGRYVLCRRLRRSFNLI